MKVGQSLPHQHQAMPLTTESLADQGLSFLRYQGNLVFPFKGQVFNALTVLSIGKAVMDMAGPKFVPNAVNRPVALTYDSMVAMYGEAVKVYQKACEQYMKDEEDGQARALELFNRNVSSLDEDLA